MDIGSKWIQIWILKVLVTGEVLPLRRMLSKLLASCLVAMGCCLIRLSVSKKKASAFVGWMVAYWKSHQMQKAKTKKQKV